MRNFRISVLLASVIWSVSAYAGTLTCDGVLGNSGEQGKTLVRFGDNRDCAGLGVVYDEYGTLWDRAGNATLNRYALDGRLIARYHLPPGSGNWNRQDQIALAGDLIVLQLQGQMYVLSVTSPAGAEPRPLNIPSERISFNAFKKCIASYYKEKIYMVNPVDGKTRMTAMAPGGANWMDTGPDGAVYVVAGDWKIHKYAGGREVTAGWPRENIGERFQLISGSWFSHTWNATIKRFTSDLEPAPGVVLGGASGSFLGHLDMNSELIKGSGMAKIRDDLFAVSGFTCIMHIVSWDDDKKQMTIIRRIGAIPYCSSLGLDKAGNVWYHAGSWKWTDAPDTPLRFGVQTPEETGQAVMLENDCMVAPGWLWGKPSFYRGPISGEVGVDRLENGCALMRGCAASTVYREADKLVLVAVSKDGNGQSFLINSNGQYAGEHGQVTLRTIVPVKEWTTLATKDANTMLGAGDGYIIELVRSGNNWDETRRWNTLSGRTFGSKIFICADSGNLWVSDREKHQVVVFNMANSAELAEFGHLNKNGDDLSALDCPEILTARRNLAVVYDSGNQRLVKLKLK